MLSFLSIHVKIWILFHEIIFIKSGDCNTLKDDTDFDLGTAISITFN